VNQSFTYVSLFTYLTYPTITASSKCEGFRTAFMSLLLYLSLLNVPALEISQKLRLTNLPQGRTQTQNSLHEATPLSTATVAEHTVCSLLRCG